MGIHLNIGRKILIAVSLPLALNVGLFFLQQNQLSALEKSHNDMIVRRNILEHVNTILSESYFGMQALMQFKMFESPQEKLAAQSHFDRMKSESVALERILKTHHVSGIEAQRLNTLMDAFMAALARSQFSPDEKNQVAGFFDDLERNIKLKKVVLSIFDELTSLRKYAQGQLDEAFDEERLKRSYFRMLSAGGLAVNIVLALAIALWLGRGLSDRVRSLKSNTMRYSRGLPLTEPLTGTDELQELDRAFRKMADQIAQAREKEQEILEEIERSRDELQSIIDKLPAAVLVVERTGRVEMINAGAHALLGYERSFFASHDVMYLFPGRKEKSIADFAPLIAQRAMALEARAMDGDLIPVEVSSITLEHNQDDKYLLTIIDQTDDMRLHLARQELFAMISHDMRSPLTSIRGIIELAIGGTYGAVSQQAAQKLSTAYDNSGYLLELVERLLESGKLAEGQIQLDLAPTSIDEMLQQARELLAGAIDKKGLVVELDLASHPQTIAADRKYLFEVFMNLLSNAIKFSPQGGRLVVRSRVETSSTSRFEHQLVVSVDDAGPGVPPGERQAIFERYRQADMQVSLDRERGKSGFGLGLAICRSIVEAHGGSIAVSESALGGARFVVTLKC